MIIAFVLVLMIVGTGITLSLYSQFLPFVYQLGDIKSYNTAYYAALGNVERASLVMRYRQPGFEGSGGRQGDTSRGPSGDGKPLSPLGFVTVGPNGSSWSISSRTTTIPSSGQSTIPRDMQGSGSEQYTMLTYGQIIAVSTDLDMTSDPQQRYQSGGLIQKSPGLQQLSGSLILPRGVIDKTDSGINKFLCIDCDADGDRVGDDALVTRKRQGIYDGTPFSIIPTDSVFYDQDPAQVNSFFDTTIRESTINAGPSNLRRGDSSLGHLLYNPLVPNISLSATGHNVISDRDTDIQPLSFSQLFSDALIEKNILSLSLDNIATNRNGLIYPFLELRLEAIGGEISDEAYHINAIGKVGNYRLTISLDKPITRDGGSSNFTIIF